MGNINLEEAIKKSIDIIYHGEKDMFQKYSASYYYTTENIRGYLENNYFNKDSALSVIGSGDQAFNLSYLGVNNIDLFDINVLTYFNFWLKYGIIMTYDYKDFKNINVDCEAYYLKNGYLFDTLLDNIKNNIPKDVYFYYKQLLDNIKNNNIIFYNNTGLINLFEIGYNCYDNSRNMYADSLASYNKTKKNLLKTNFNFTFGDARNVAYRVNNNYDIILLSNISDYLGKELNPLILFKFNQYLDRYYKLLNNNGLLINYFYFLNKEYVIKNSMIKKDDLNKDNLYCLENNEGYYLIRKK